MLAVSKSKPIKHLRNVRALVEAVVTFRSPLYTHTNKPRDWATPVVCDLELRLHLREDSVIDAPVIESAGKIIDVDQNFQPAVTITEGEQALIRLGLDSSHLFEAVADQFVEQAGALLAAIDCFEKMADNSGLTFRAEACAEDVDDAARLLQLPPRVAESARVAEARAEDVDVAAGLPQRPPRVAENAREAEARAEDVDDAARLLQLPPRVAESAREAEACAEDVEAAARLRQMPPLESPSDHGFEPFGIPSSELDEHKFPTTEPGLPDLDHCFVEGRACNM